MKQEVWKDIKGYEGIYQVSNLGRVKGLRKRNNAYNVYYKKEFIMKLQKNHKGYLKVQLNNDLIKRKMFFVHRLVAEAFIPNPNNLPQINHKDENKENNVVDNLEWCDNSYNQKYGSTCDYRRKKVVQLDKNANVLKIWRSITEACEHYGIPISNISAVCHHKRKTIKGYKWVFLDEYRDKKLVK
jgi:hypothetical protein